MPRNLLFSPALPLSLAAPALHAAEVTPPNVSCDTNRDLYRDIDTSSAAQWQATPPVAVVDRHVEKHNARKMAEAYLQASNDSRKAS